VVRNERLLLFLRVYDDQLVYHNPASRLIASGDSVIIRVPDESGAIRRYTFRAEAQGLLDARYAGAAIEGVRPVIKAPDYRAAFVETSRGYNLEIDIPWPAEGIFGLTVMDRDRPAGPVLWSGMFDPDIVDETGVVRTFDDRLGSLLLDRTDNGMRMRLFDAQGWLVADADRRQPDAQVRRAVFNSDNFIDSILLRFIRASLGSDISTTPLPSYRSGKLSNETLLELAQLADSSRFMRDRYGRIFLVQVRAIQSTAGDLFGYLLIQQPRVAMSAITEQAVLRLVKIFLLAALAIAVVLLGFASLLSWRIRRLRDQVEASVNREGASTVPFVASAARDEIGDLARSFAGINQRQRGYSAYLQTLGSRLSHELRTPLTVLRTSLESIDSDALDEHTFACLQRASGGAERLNTLIRNLTEASSLEQTIGNSTLAPLALDEWLSVAWQIYTDTFVDSRFELHIEPTARPAWVSGSAELLQQMMDKLIANARDFADPDSAIVLSLRPQQQRWLLQVRNNGPALPEHLQMQIFNSMVSAREQRDDQPHMGLGLYIVSLVADYHGASVSAGNEAGRTVCIGVSFPSISAPANQSDAAPD